MAAQPTLQLSTGIQYNAPPPKQNDRSVWNLDGYIFDGWLRLSHSVSATLTQHPVQYGSPISDHYFVNAREYSFEIGVTDVVEAVQGRQYPGGNTKSINAYNAILSLMGVNSDGTRIANPKFLKLTSKYGYTDKVMIRNFDVPDDFLTNESLRATLTLTEVIVVGVRQVRVSRRPQQTDVTNRGRINTIPRQSILREGTGTTARQVGRNLFGGG